MRVTKRQREDQHEDDVIQKYADANADQSEERREEPEELVAVSKQQIILCVDNDRLRGVASPWQDSMYA